MRVEIQFDDSRPTHAFERTEVGWDHLIANQFEEKLTETEFWGLLGQIVGGGA